MIEEIIKELVDKINLKKYLWIFFILIINIIVIAGILYINNEKEDNYETDNYTSFIESSENNNEIELKNDEKIIVHITGEVNNPGVYELNIDSRISDVIECAGGMTSDANLDKVNLAYKLSDGQKIKIPSIKNEKDENNIIIDEENEIIEDSYSKDKRVNINTALKSELMSISGIGESTAQKIIEYRTDNGRYNTIEDIKNVSGIGDSKYNQIKDYIKVQ